MARTKSTVVQRVQRRIQKLKERREVAAATWEDSDGILRRRYDTYEDYLRHQASKLDRRSSVIERYDADLREALTDRLKGESWTGLRVLCLAARLGGEVAAFRELGAVAVGIDLNPGAKNPYVMYGDFHDLKWPDRSTDIVFTNSLDHALDLKRLVAEVRRVLLPNGVFLVEAMDFDSKPPGGWEVSVWKSPDDLVTAISSMRFELIESRRIARPWEGWQLRFQPEREDTAGDRTGQTG